MSSQYSNDLHQISIQPLGCTETGDSHHGCVEPCDAVMKIWNKISEKCFQHLVESMPWIIKAVQKAKGGPNWYYQAVPTVIKWPMSVLQEARGRQGKEDRTGSHWEAQSVTKETVAFRKQKHRGRTYFLWTDRWNCLRGPRWVTRLQSQNEPKRVIVYV